jgi:cytochrome P450
MALLSSPKSEDPQDHLQMMLRCAETDHKTELNLDDMTGRLVMANFGSFHQTSIAITNVIFNILESDKEYNTIALLREEARAVLEKSGGVWSKAAVSQMVCADSVCRESLRINSFGNRSLIRKVMVDDLRTEDGILLPKGALVSILAHPAQCDGDIFSDPLKFDPFRFSRMRQQSSSIPHSIGAAESEDTKISANGANLALVSTGPQNLPFGHGRHACPGRFLLDFELKMILAYLFTNYDVELVRKYEGQKLQAEWMAEAMMPPTAGKIRVKRRVPSS